MAALPWLAARLWLSLVYWLLGSGCRYIMAVSDNVAADHPWLTGLDRLLIFSG